MQTRRQGVRLVTRFVVQSNQAARLESLPAKSFHHDPDLPFLPVRGRYDAVAARGIGHALRFTTDRTRTSYVYPARHQAGESGSLSLPPMGVRVRLKATYDTSGFSPQARVIAEALKHYGMILADNGSPWYVTGASDPRFDDDVLHQLDVIKGSDLEVVDTTGLVNGP